MPRRSKGESGSLFELTPKPKADVTRWMDHYRAQHQQKWGSEPVIYWGKNGKQAKGLIEAIGLEAALQVVDDFFRSTDPRITRTDYSVGAVVTNAQYLRVSGKQPDHRLQASAAMIRRVTGRNR